jgi:hypothetical protein
MKTVWLLIEDYGYEGFSIRGAFSTKEKAQAAMDDWKAKNRDDDMYIEDYKIDETCGEK